MGRPPRVVCLGGGYVAVWLVKALRGAVRRRTVDLTVVDRDNFHTFHGFVPEMLGGRISPGGISSPARKLFAPARFHNGDITHIDVERKVIVASRRLDGRETQIPYDHLVVGLGAGDDIARYPGLAEHAFRVHRYADALRTRNHLLGMMEMAAIEVDPDERRRLLTFVVAGGGYGGIEIVTELDDFLRGLTEDEYPQISADEIRVVCLHSGDHVLHELEERHPQLQAWAERFIDERTHVEVMRRTRIASATATEAILEDGTRIPTRTIISSTGTAQSPLLDQLPYPRDERGRLRTDELLNVLGATDVWAGGDCAANPHPRGGTNPPLAVFAMATGWRIGRNIVARTRGTAPRPYRFVELGDACALGRRRAVGHVRGLPVRGLPAWIMWRLTLLAFLPAADRRLRVVLDWIVTPLTGRDTAMLQLDEPVGVRRELYEPGQVVIAEGDVGRRLYVVRSGSVEVFRTLPGGAEEVLATLERGAHFGEMAVFEESRRSASVRARERTELVSLGHVEAQTLSAAVSPIGEALRRRPGPEDPTAAAVAKEAP